MLRILGTVCLSTLDTPVLRGITRQATADLSRLAVADDVNSSPGYMRTRVESLKRSSFGVLSLSPSIRHSRGIFIHRRGAFSLLPSHILAALLLAATALHPGLPAALAASHIVQRSIKNLSQHYGVAGRPCAIIGTLSGANLDSTRLRWAMSSCSLLSSL